MSSTRNRDINIVLRHKFHTGNDVILISNVGNDVLEEESCISICIRTHEFHPFSLDNHSQLACCTQHSIFLLQHSNPH